MNIFQLNSIDLRFCNNYQAPVQSKVLYQQTPKSEKRGKDLGLTLKLHELEVSQVLDLDGIIFGAPGVQILDLCVSVCAELY